MNELEGTSFFLFSLGNKLVELEGLNVNGVELVNICKIILIRERVLRDALLKVGTDIFLLN